MRPGRPPTQKPDEIRVRKGYDESWFLACGTGGRHSPNSVFLNQFGRNLNRIRSYESLGDVLSTQHLQNRIKK